MPEKNNLQEIYDQIEREVLIFQKIDQLYLYNDLLEPGGNLMERHLSYQFEAGEQHDDFSAEKYIEQPAPDSVLQAFDLLDVFQEDSNQNGKLDDIINEYVSLSTLFDNDPLLTQLESRLSATETNDPKLLRAIEIRRASLAAMIVIDIINCSRENELDY